MNRELVLWAKRVLGPRYWATKRLLDRYVFTYRKTHYSQFGEDVFLLEHFRDKHDGIYVDVGAFHPRQCSNTYALYRRGWRGLVVDATPGSSVLFRAVRPRDVVVEAAVSDCSDPVEFASWGAHLENTADAAQARAVEVNYGQPLERYSMTPRTLDELLSEHLPGEQIDLLSVDVEGFDLKVLRSADWSTFKPGIVVVEAFGFDMEAPWENDVFAFLRNRGYKVVAWMPPSLVFQA